MILGLARLKNSDTDIEDSDQDGDASHEGMGSSDKATDQSSANMADFDEDIPWPGTALDTAKAQKKIQMLSRLFYNEIVIIFQSLFTNDHALFNKENS